MYNLDWPAYLRKEFPERDEHQIRVDERYRSLFGDTPLDELDQDDWILWGEHLIANDLTHDCSQVEWIAIRRAKERYSLAQRWCMAFEQFLNQLTGETDDTSREEEAESVTEDSRGNDGDATGQVS